MKAFPDMTSREQNESLQKYKKYFNIRRNKMIRTVNTDDIVKNIKEMCIEANHYLSKDMDKALKDATASENQNLVKNIKSASGELENCR